LAIGSMMTLTVLAKRGAVSETDTAAARVFAQGRGFDLVHFPRMPSADANRRIQIAEPVYYQGGRALLGPDPSDFIARYEFDIAAATDDRPYFEDVSRRDGQPGACRRAGHRAGYLARLARRGRSRHLVELAHRPGEPPGQRRDLRRAGLRA